jgi:hypothetical protein
MLHCFFTIEKAGLIISSGAKSVLIEWSYISRIERDFILGNKEIFIYFNSVGYERVSNQLNGSTLVERRLRRLLLNDDFDLGISGSLIEGDIDSFYNLLLEHLEKS